MPDTTSDHDLLLRLDERMEAIQDLVATLSNKVTLASTDIVDLRIDAAKFGALGGFLAGLVVNLVTVWIWSYLKGN